MFIELSGGFSSGGFIRRRGTSFFGPLSEELIIQLSYTSLPMYAIENRSSKSSLTKICSAFNSFLLVNLYNLLTNHLLSHCVFFTKFIIIKNNIQISVI